MSASTQTTRCAAGDRERGTALVLLPAMALVLIVLGAIALDLTAAHAAQRSLYRTASAAADDAAGMIDGRALQVQGIVRIDAVAANQVARSRIQGASVPGSIENMVVLVEDRSVEVRLRVRIEHIFMDALPGTQFEQSVQIRVLARMEP